MRGIILSTLALVAACAGESSTTESTQALSPELKHGRDVWFNETFGGERFFSGIVQAPPFNLPIGLDVALTSPRATRFTQWGLINDPDCTAGDASTGGFDRCQDPESAGVIGVRKKVVLTASGPRVMIGVSCASCHAGLDPANPPADPNNPSWENIHATVGNQYINIAKIFSAHLPPYDPRYQVFNSWAPGTVDTTAIESDHINNAGIITQFFNVPDRPFFDLHDEGMPINVHRGGQGGEDDAGCEKAALRVYFNIGMCAAECMVGHLANGPGGTQTEIDDAECSAACPDYVRAKAEVGGMCAFMATTKPPKLEDAPGGADEIDTAVLDRGKQVFKLACAGCHSNGQPAGHDVLSNDEVSPWPLIGTNRCRSLSTNWKDGEIWGQFSSDEYKARPGYSIAGITQAPGGPGYYRNVPLLGVWATAPFLHNNRLGGYNGDPSVAGRLAAYEDAMDQLLNPGHRNVPGSMIVTSSPVFVPKPGGGFDTLPAGIPVNAIASKGYCDNPLLGDFFENQGHYFGSALPASDKYALKEYLKTK
jgi:mono/diheme cytochrome c family protein